MHIVVILNFLYLLSQKFIATLDATIIAAFWWSVLSWKIMKT